MKEEKTKIITQQDVRFVFAIIVFLVPILACYFSIKENLALINQKLDTIKSNDLAHIEISLSDMKARNDIQDVRTIELGLKLERLMTLQGQN